MQGLQPGHVFDPAKARQESLAPSAELELQAQGQPFQQSLAQALFDAFFDALSDASFKAPLFRTTLDTADVGHMFFLLVLLHLAPKLLVQVLGKYHQPVDEAEELLHFLPRIAALVQAPHQPQLPNPTAFRVLAGLERLQVSPHQGGKRVGVPFQDLVLGGVVQQLCTSMWMSTQASWPSGRQTLTSLSTAAYGWSSIAERVAAGALPSSRPTCENAWTSTRMQR